MILRAGDTVTWRGAFGLDEPKPATVTEIELTEGRIDGDFVQEIDWTEVYGRNVVLYLDNGSWAYGCQIERIGCEGIPYADDETSQHYLPDEDDAYEPDRQQEIEEAARRAEQGSAARRVTDEIIALAREFPGLNLIHRQAD